MESSGDEKSLKWERVSHGCGIMALSVIPGDPTLMEPSGHKQAYYRVTPAIVEDGELGAKFLYRVSGSSERMGAPCVDRGSHAEAMAACEAHEREYIEKPPDVPNIGSMTMQEAFRPSAESAIGTVLDNDRRESQGSPLNWSDVSDSYSVSCGSGHMIYEVRYDPSAVGWVVCAAGVNRGLIQASRHEAKACCQRIEDARQQQEPDSLLAWRWVDWSEVDGWERYERHLGADSCVGGFYILQFGVEGGKVRIQIDDPGCDECAEAETVQEAMEYCEAAERKKMGEGCSCPGGEPLSYGDTVPAGVPVTLMGGEESESPQEGWDCTDGEPVPVGDTISSVISAVAAMDVANVAEGRLIVVSRRQLDLIQSSCGVLVDMGKSERGDFPATLWHGLARYCGTLVGVPVYVVNAFGMYRSEAHAECRVKQCGEPMRNTNPPSVADVDCGLVVSGKWRDGSRIKLRRVGGRWKAVVKVPRR